MIRIAIVFICTCALASPLSAMVGGAPPTSEGAGRAVVMLTGSHGTFCSGVALARGLVLTAAHCVLPGADYKLVEFGPARQIVPPGELGRLVGPQHDAPPLFVIGRRS